MGQQVYEEELIARAPAALGDAARVRRTIARSLRSPLPGTVRLPTWITGRAPTAVRRVVGAAMYPGADVVHRMGLGLPPARVPEIITIHDTVAWRFDDESAPEPFAAAELRRAAAVVAPSQFSADDAAEFLGLQRVHAIPNGVDSRFLDAPALSAARLQELGVTGPYVLHAGGASKRKNLDALAQAWQRVASARPDVTLVLSGPAHPRRTALFAPLPRTALIGRVPSEDVPGLVAAASVVVVPSLHEGFGLPALEAMAAGTPVVAARTSALPEVVGEGGILVEPTPDEIAQGILWALEHDAGVAARVQTGRIRAAEFTWERSARAHAELWRSVVR
ncbi:glycosyltransferase family 4 protein [Microbacterium xylanilyticum]